MGVNWPLVTAGVERMWCGLHAGEVAASGEPLNGLESIKCLLERLRGEGMQRADPLDRAYVYASSLLVVMSQLHAFCSASLFTEGDLEALNQPAEPELPLHGLMALGVPTVALVRWFRIEGKEDIRAVRVNGPQSVRLGSAYGINTYQAIWNLAAKVAESCEHFTGGLFAPEQIDHQSFVDLERAWLLFCKDLKQLLPDALEVDQAQAQLEIELLATRAACRTELEPAFCRLESLPTEQGPAAEAESLPLAGEDAETATVAGTSTAGPSAPRDGDVDGKGRVYLAGDWHSFGPSQKELLLWIMKNQNGNVADAFRDLGFLSCNEHMNKVLHDLRKNLKIKLKKAKHSLHIILENRTLSYSWVERGQR